MKNKIKVLVLLLFTSLQGFSQVVKIYNKGGVITVNPPDGPIFTCTDVFLTEQAGGYIRITTNNQFFKNEIKVLSSQIRDSTNASICNSWSSCVTAVGNIVALAQSSGSGLQASGGTGIPISSGTAFSWISGTTGQYVRGNGTLSTLSTDVQSVGDARYVKLSNIISDSYSGDGTATTSFTVTIGSTLSNANYKVNVTPTSLLGASSFYVTNKTTTTFDVVYLTGLTGTLTFDWSIFL